ncbi:hypothetical protein P6F34_gp37 [Pseudomonas phage MiCath]|uniref:Uncharacterized protein n=1 Tax=Pseudomonas phage MiCath TaxID=3003729 RepID=A0AAE9VDE7_9CAUD|nr:hypothetical protein P6F34_gp37 [Pseudomonas phage MiCath]WAX22389.1 hypothetical protein [Pseudomonas phage MiCath]
MKHLTVKEQAAWLSRVQDLAARAWEEAHANRVAYSFISRRYWGR